MPRPWAPTPLMFCSWPVGLSEPTVAHIFRIKAPCRFFFTWEDWSFEIFKGPGPPMIWRAWTRFCEKRDSTSKGLQFFYHLLLHSHTFRVLSMDSKKCDLRGWHENWCTSGLHEFLRTFDSFVNQRANAINAILSGWWFGTFFIFPYIGNVIIPVIKEYVFSWFFFCLFLIQTLPSDLLDGVFSLIPRARRSEGWLSILSVNT